MFAPGDLTVDAKRFQFKAGGDEAGVTDRLMASRSGIPSRLAWCWSGRTARGRTSSSMATSAMPLRRALPRMIHRRKPQLLARVVREADGVTDVAARVMAAAKNIAEGTGQCGRRRKVLRDAPTLW